MLRSTRFLNILFLLFALGSLAGPLALGQTEPNSAEIQVSRPIELSDAQTRELIESAEIQIEGHVHGEGEKAHSHSHEHEAEAPLIKRWRESLNLKQSFLKTYRWYQTQAAQNGTTIHEIALDISILLAGSHALETVSGPVMVFAGTALDWPLWLTTLAGTAGGIISIPGLDPLCIGLIYLYKKSNRFRKIVTYARVVTVRTATVLTRPILKPFLKRVPPLDFLGPRTLTIANGLLYETFTFDEGRLRRLTFETNAKGQTYLIQSVWDSKSETDRKDFIRQMKSFPWNLRNGLISTFDALQISAHQTEHLPFVETTVEHKQEVAVQYKRGPLFVRAPLRFKNPLRGNAFPTMSALSCRGLFL